MQVDWALYALAALVIFVAAVVQGIAGIGFGMLAAPLFAIIHPVLVPGPLLMLGLLAALLVVLREVHGVDMRGLAWCLAGRFPAAVLAGYTLALLPAGAFAVMFGLLILTAAGISLTGWRLPSTPASMFGAGALSGYMGTVTSVGGPPMALLYQYRQGPVPRATLGVYFVIGSALSLGALAFFGHFGGAEALLALKLVPPLVAGFWLSGQGRRYVDAGWLRPLVLMLSSAAALVLVVSGVQGLLW